MGIQPNAIERMVGTFRMGGGLPEELDFDSPAIKALVASMNPSRRKTFLAMAKDPDVRKISNVFNTGLGKYWERVVTAKEKGRKLVFMPFNFSPEIFYALDMVSVCVEVLNTMTMTLEEGIPLIWTWPWNGVCLIRCVPRKGRLWACWKPRSSPNPTC